VLDKLAQAFAKDGRTEDAEKCYGRIPSRSRKAYVNRNYGKLLVDAAKPENAEKVLRRAIEQEQRNHYGHYYLALTLCKQERYREAVSELREACKLKIANYTSEFKEAADLLEQIGRDHPNALEPGSPARGIVQAFNTERGFGFILADDEKRRFFHISSWISNAELKPGLRVEFEPSESQKGLAAKDVAPEEPPG